MTIDPRERFRDAAPWYDRYRPSYPDELLDWILSAAGTPAGARVADVGCGTGIASRLLAARGLSVVGVEPNEAMRERAREAGGMEVRAGEAAATGLPDASVALVVAAQSFHYFEPDATLREWRRILHPGGACAVFWNRVAGDLRAAIKALRRRHQPPDDSRRASRKREIVARLEARAELTGVVSRRFRHVQTLDLGGFLGRLASSSRLAGTFRENEAARTDFEDFFAARAGPDGLFRLPLEALAVVWRFRTVPAAAS